MAALANKTSLRLVIKHGSAQYWRADERVLLIIHLPSSSLQDVVVVSCTQGPFEGLLLPTGWESPIESLVSSCASAVDLRRNVLAKSGVVYYYSVDGTSLC
jgi:hypothetical protein